jgi:diguanylate cyclase (GGDEF)-like protein/PAS domain S-box-containing protein
MQISAMDAAGDQIVITDPVGTISFVNAAFERATGYSREEVIGKRAVDLVYADGSRDGDDEVRRAMLAGEPWQGEVMGMRKDGTACPEEVTVTPVFGEDGVVEHCIAIKRDITQQKMYEARLDLLAHHDALTGLPNRLLFSDRLSQRIAEARRRGEQVAVMFLDIDRFKLVNDTLGHNAGDRLLAQVGERLKSTIREADTVARMGGDEFTVVLSQGRYAEDASRIARRILDLLANPFHLDDHELYLTASIGISVFPADGSDVETLVRNADAAMYHAKERGKNTFHFYTEALNIAAVERMTLESGLRRALEHEELVAYYQPCVDIRTGRIVSVEALVRWRHPDLKLVTPDQFIPLAEETGLIVPIGEWMLRQASAQNKSWQDRGLGHFEVGVNISAKQFQFADLAEVVRTTLADTGLSPEYLVLELTESALMLNPDHAVRVLRGLKKFGVKVFIDDFGTGYSSLSHLKCFPIDAVKIDRSFIRDITKDADDAAIAGAVIAMAHSLKLKVIAEGVETLDQLEFLRSLDCDQMQGYFVSRPAPAEELADVLMSSDLLARGRMQRSA